MGWLPFKNELRELIYGNGLAEGWLVYILDIHAVLGIWAGWDQMGWPEERLFSFVHLRQSQQMGWLRLGLAKKPLPSFLSVLDSDSKFEHVFHEFWQSSVEIVISFEKVLDRIIFSG